MRLARRSEVCWRPALVASSAPSRRGSRRRLALPGAATVTYATLVLSWTLYLLLASLRAHSPFYVAAFQELERAFGEFSDGGVTRVVAFVDDLDRCLPGNALDVLESMKLFFDLPGFVFGSLGLDEDVVERAIRAKFAEGDAAAVPSASSQALAGRRLGREYVKQIFQVPYSLPAMIPQQLDDLLTSMYREAGLDEKQLDDLRGRVRPYLNYVAVERRVNPREVKRFINTYIIQTTDPEKNSIGSTGIGPSDVSWLSATSGHRFIVLYLRTRAPPDKRP